MESDSPSCSAAESSTAVGYWASSSSRHVRLRHVRLGFAVLRAQLRRAPRTLVEQRLQHRAEVHAALGAEFVREPFDRTRTPAGHLLRVHVVHARESLVGHAPTERQGKQLPLPRIKTLKSASELFGLDHAAVT